MPTDRIVYLRPWNPDLYPVDEFYSFRIGAVLIQSQCVKRDDQAHCFHLREISREVIFGDLDRPENWHTPPSKN